MHDKENNTRRQRPEPEEINNLTPEMARVGVQNWESYIRGVTPVPVSVCCMLFVLQKVHIKRNPNGIKTDGDFFGIYVIFGKKNQRETMPEGATRQGARPGPSWPPRKVVDVKEICPRGNNKVIIYFRIS